MAGSIKRDLFVNITGSAAELSTAAKAGRTALLDLNQAAVSIVDQISENMRKMGTSATAPLAEMERNFKTSLGNIRNELRSLQSSGDNGAMLKFFDTNSINQQIAQGERLTAQYRLIAEAAQEVARGGGANAASASVWAASYGTLAAQTGLETEKLREQAVAQEAVLGKMSAMPGASKAVTAASGQQRAGLQQLAYNINDVTTMYGLHASAQQIFVSQSGQIIQSLSLMTMGGSGWLATVGRFAPYILIATSALIPFISYILKSNDAIGQSVEKMKAEAAQTAVTDEAKAKFGRTVEGVTAAVHDQEVALDKLLAGEKTAAAQANILAQAELQRAINIRDTTKALLEQANAEYDRQVALAGGDPSGGQMVAGAAVERGRVKEDLAKADAALTIAINNFDKSRVALAADLGKAEADPRGQVSKPFDKRINDAQAATVAAIEAARAAGKNTNGLANALVDTIADIEKARAAALAKYDKAHREAERAAPAGTITDFGRPVVGGTITGRFGDDRGDHTHKGADYAVPVGTPVYATADGKVNRAGLLDPKGYGNLIEIDSGAGTKERFGHLSEIKVKLGEIVAKGDLIGYSGGAKGAPGAGDSQGPHLHYEVLRNGRAVDPTKGRYPTDIVAKGNEGQRAQDTEEQKADSYRRALDQANADNLRAKRALVDKSDDELAVQLDQIAARKDALDAQVDAAVAEGKVPGQTAEEVKLNADKLKALYRDTALTEGIAATRADIARKARDELDIADNRARNDVEFLRLEESLATTLKERKRLALEALDRDYKAQRARLSGVIDDPNASKKDRAIASDNRDALDRAQPDRVKAENKRHAGPLEQFRDELKTATGDMNVALQGVAVHGLQNLEDGLLGIIDGTESVGSAFKKMANAIIADLARIAIEKLIVKAIGSIGGFSDGGIGSSLSASVHGHATGHIPGFASGIINGPGTGTSDSILAVLDNRLIRVSNGESIMTAEATRRFGPTLKAMNENLIPGFAGGVVPSYPAVPSPETMRGYQHVTVDNRLKIEPSPLFDTKMTQRAVQVTRLAAPAIMDGAEDQTIRRISRPALSGQYG